MFRALRKRGGVKLLAATLAVGAMCAWSRAATPDDSGNREYRLKANFLVTAPDFVEWPAGRSNGGQNTFFVCVTGRYSFGMQLAEMTRSKEVKGKRVEVKWVRKDVELRNCQVVFVSRSEEKRYGSILQALEGSSALTVGETRGFLDAGGMVTLETTERGLKFEINLEATNEAGLRLSSRLLALAGRVVQGSKLAER